MEITLHAVVGFFSYAVPHNDSPTIITKISAKSTGDYKGIAFVDYPDSIIDIDTH